jgi:protein-L-isoaspartate O-methyltransferase
VRRPPEGLEHTPCEAIVVAAGGPQVSGVPEAQLKIGGRLVIPVGADRRAQELVRVTRVSENNYRSEDIADLRFVPFDRGGGVGDREGR